MTDCWYFIVNPTAGGGKVKRRWPSIEERLKNAGITFKTSFSKAKGHATFITEQLIAEGARKIVAVGGDGTNNEVINGIINQTTISSKEITYTLFPIGTGNDWIRTHRIPKKIDDWISMLQAELCIYQDIGKATYYRDGKQQFRYFANIAGMAYDAFLVKKLEESKTIFPPKLQYILSTVFSLFQYKLRKAKITTKDHLINDYCYTINIGICQYAGGGMQIVPHADPNDGLLAVTVVTNASKWYVIRKLNYLYNGKISELDLVKIFQTESIKIEAGDKISTLIEVDGEYLGETPVEISVLQGALKVVVPIF